MASPLAGVANQQRTGGPGTISSEFFCRSQKTAISNQRSAIKAIQINERDYAVSVFLSNRRGNGEGTVKPRQFATIDGELVRCGAHRDPIENEN